LLVRVVYHPRYNISLFGLERLHPFDSRKYGRAWAVLQEQLGSGLAKYHVPVDRPVSDEELLMVHSAGYLSRLRSAKVIAQTLEMPLFQFSPAWLLRWRVLTPMRWATRGSVLAARAALETGVAVNLSGGYHHAKPTQGEGFCVFSDAALMVRQLRAEGKFQVTDRIAYIDLDAHQGNGVCHQFCGDREVFIFDMYNKDTYPSEDCEARERIDCKVPLGVNCSGAEYLRLLRDKLPGFLDSISKSATVKLGIYNAGTDVFAGDKLGGLRLSAEDILARDLFVMRELEERRIPVVMLLSGGYSSESYRLVAATVLELINRRSSSANWR
jgi:histone deacetylase 11